MGTILLTGATGFVGSNILYDLVRGGWRSGVSRVCCLVRPHDDAGPDQRLLSALNECAITRNETPLSALPPGVRAVAGDLDNPDRVVPHLLSGGPLTVIHNAAALSFEPANRELVYRTNITGLNNLLASLEACPPTHFIFVSTAFCCGTRRGSIPERFHWQQNEFNNAYEQSKCQGEQIIAQWSARHRTRLTVVRPSIVMGNARSLHPGSSDDSYYGLIRRLGQLHQSPLSAQAPLRFECDPDTRLDLVPVDHVSAIITARASKAPEGNEVIHAASGVGLRMGAMLEAVNTVLGYELVRPGLFDPAGFSDAERRIFDRSAIYRPYMHQDKHFEVQPANRFSGTGALLVPWVQRYLAERGFVDQEGVA